MNLDDTLQRMEQLEKKFQAVLVRYHSVQKQLEATIAENLEQKEIIKMLQLEINNFQNQQKMYNIVSSIITDAETPAGLKKKLNEYIEEIEHCIDLLKQS
jgi:chaperonin cofactor prefoldin